MRRLIDVAEGLEPGTRLKISELDAKNARGRRVYTPPLTEAQIYAYQEWIVLRTQNLRGADGIKQTLCTVTAPQNARALKAQRRRKTSGKQKDADKEAAKDG